MKKLGKFLVVGAVAAVACAALVGCGKDYTGSYNGEYKYSSTWGGYGVTGAVEVKGEKITKVTCTDPEGYHNITASWKENQHEGDLGHDKAAAGLEAYITSHIVGKTVDEIKAINVAVEEGGAPTVGAEASGQGDFIYTGATQTSGRIILAIQNALKDVK